MGNQNPSEVHGLIRASNYRSHTSWLNVSLSASQPALWVSICRTRSFLCSHPSPRRHGSDPSPGRGGQDGTGRDIPHCPGSAAAAPSRSACEATGSEPLLAPRPPQRAERARDAHPTPFRELWGTTEALPPAGMGGRQHRRCRTPPQPLTSVSMGSTSIPFHSSSKWAIGMLGDSCLRTGASTRSARRPPAEAEKRRCPWGTGHGAEWDRDPARTRTAKWLRAAPGEPREGRGRSAGAGGRTRQRPPLRSRPRSPAARPVPSLWAAATALARF